MPGITRNSLIALAHDMGMTVREERYGLDQWKADAASGRLVEVFACGTAAVVAPIGQVKGKGFDPRKLLLPGYEAILAKVEEKMNKEEQKSLVLKIPNKEW